MCGPNFCAMRISQNIRRDGEDCPDSGDAAAQEAQGEDM